MKVRTQQTGGTLPQSEDDNIDIDDLVDSDAPAATDFAEPFPQSAAEFEPIPAE
jgi:lipoprotein, vacJ family